MLDSITPEPGWRYRFRCQLGSEALLPTIDTTFGIKSGARAGRRPTCTRPATGIEPVWLHPAEAGSVRPVAADRVALGIDQGSSGARAVVMTPDGQVLGSGRAPCRDLRRTSSGTHHDPAAWLDESVSAARSALHAAGCERVDAIGVGALGPAPVVIDSDLRPLTASPLFPIDPNFGCNRIHHGCFIPELDVVQDHPLH